jgi:hypothetical protein
MEEITNKVAQSGLVQIDLEELYPEDERVLIDLKDWLFEGLILKEKDFRESIRLHNWNQYTGKFVAITCTADAIVPTWAYMLIAAHVEPICKKIVFGNLQKLEENIFKDIIHSLDAEKFRNQRVVIKGCSDHVPLSAYVDLTTFLRPLVKNIMYGEPCSTVPVYKSKN